MHARRLAPRRNASRRVVAHRVASHRTERAPAPAPPRCTTMRGRACVAPRVEQSPPPPPRRAAPASSTAARAPRRRARGSGPAAASAFAALWFTLLASSLPSRAAAEGSAQCNHPHGEEQDDGSCVCAEGFAGAAFEEHAGKWCGGMEYQSGISTAAACKQGCADDADCNFVTFYTSSSECAFSSACDFRSWSGRIVYVSLVLAAGGRGRPSRGAASAPSSLPHHSLFSFISPPPSLSEQLRCGSR